MNTNDPLNQKLLPSQNDLMAIPEASPNRSTTSNVGDGTPRPSSSSVFSDTYPYYRPTLTGSPGFPSAHNPSKYEKLASVPVRIFPERIRKRIVLKSGAINLGQEKIHKRNRRYLQDTLTTMVDVRWRYNLFVFVFGFLGTWLLFAVLWYILAYFHGDLDRESSSDQCIVGVNTFLAAFYFSFESQATLGFGSRYPADNCILGVALLCVQAIVGAMIQCFVVGFVFAKLSRPNKRISTLMFSRNAVISRRDGKLCLLFRVGDIRNKSYIIGASVSALVIGKKITKEGEVLPYYHEELKVRFEGCGNNIFLMWPATIIHDIESTSPFYWMNADQLSKSKFEIVVMLKGSIESTGQTIEARTSYMPSEIFWGRRFCQIIDYRMDIGQYRVDYSKFDTTYEVHTPNISAKQFTRVRSSITSFIERGQEEPKRSIDEDQVFI